MIDFIAIAVMPNFRGIRGPYMLNTFQDPCQQRKKKKKKKLAIGICFHYINLIMSPFLSLASEILARTRLSDGRYTYF